MDTQERIEKEREAQRRASARRSRAGFLRGRVIAVSILCFGVLWAVVFAQMATGNDPVLSTKPQTATTQADKRRASSPHRTKTNTIESEAEPAEAEVVEQPEVEFVEPERIEEPEILEEPEVVEGVELEPLTTSQS